MKKILFVLLACSFLMTSCKKDDGKISLDVIEDEAVMKFDNDVLDFHTLNAGEKVTGSFHFTNTGSHDLVISDVSANCGCTIADYPHEAIKPGKDGMISVTYDSKGARGLRIQKDITVVANTTPNAHVLKIVADVQ